MIRVFLIILSMSFVCALHAQKNQLSTTQFIDSLLSMEKVLSANADVNESARSAVSYLNTVEDLHNLYPEHERCPEFLFRAGDVAVGLKKYNRALSFWSLLTAHYKGHELHGRAAFFTAFVLDSKLGKKKEALEAYNAFLTAFPENELVPSAEMLRGQLEMSEEQLIEKFKQKN